jgi:hypothetical protein
MSSETPYYPTHAHVRKLAWLTLTLIFGLMPLPSATQEASALTQDISGRLIVYGRVEDAVSEEPVAGTIIIAGDSTWTVTADSLGNFAIPLNPSPPYVIVAEQLGYASTVFELPEPVVSRLALIRIQPAPILVDGFTVVEESQLATLVDRLEVRRNGYAGSLRVFDRAQLLNDASGSALDLVRRRYPNARLCGTFGPEGSGYDPNQLCRATRGRVGEILICVDGRRSLLHVRDLEVLPVEQVALAEFYGTTVGLGLYRGGRLLGALGTSWFSAGPTYDLGQVRLYTPQWLARSAGRPRALVPVGFGC